MVRRTPMLVAAALILLESAAFAHKPSYTEGAHGTSGDAFPVANPDVSIVLYHRVTCEAQQLWMAFPIRPPYNLYLQLGVPEIERLVDYRPSVALLAPGLPEPPEGLPFDVPEGYGAIVVDTSDVTTPGTFYEPFTQTSSWVLHEATYTLTEEATGYVVAWHPERETGKLWVATGTVEQFGPEDAANFEYWQTNTQAFHEVGQYAPDPEPVEIICDDPEPEPEPTPEPTDPAEPTGGDDPQPEEPEPGDSPPGSESPGGAIQDAPTAGTQPAGCSAGSSPSEAATALALMLIFALTRRRRLTGAVN